jgi:hypothetical protein
MSETLEERLRRHAQDDPNSMFKAYPGDLVELLDELQSTLQISNTLLDMAQSAYTKLERKMDKINKFNIDDYIQSLHWTPDAKDYEITLVAGNLRSLYYRLTKGIHETDDSDQAYYRNEEK